VDEWAYSYVIDNLKETMNFVHIATISAGTGFTNIIGKTVPPFRLRTNEKTHWQQQQKRDSKRSIERNYMARVGTDIVSDLIVDANWDVSLSGGTFIFRKTVTDIDLGMRKNKSVGFERPTSIPVTAAPVPVVSPIWKHEDDYDNWLKHRSLDDQSLEICRSAKDLDPQGLDISTLVNNLPDCSKYTGGQVTGLLRNYL
jgi:hypothetical protein